MNSEKNDSLLIVGCGWVGKKLGHQLENKGTIVYGTTRSSSNFSNLSDHLIKAVKLNLPVSSPSKIRIPDTATVLISISPGRGEDRSSYPANIGQLAKVLAQRNAQVIMYSSTSSYGNINGEVSEDDVEPKTESKNVILAAEGVLREHIPNAVILRLAGLYGNDRHPAKYLAGRKGIKDGDAPVNLVHREDVIRATEMIIRKGLHGEIFNICAPVHPTKKEVYTTIAGKLGLNKPEFLAGGEDGKQISSDKIMSFGFEFINKDPLSFLET
jgi:nucleoside-diphosphate-sugar epimerase